MAQSDRPTLIAAESQVYVEYIGTASAFYVDKLGFELIFSHGEPPSYAQVGRDGARLDLRCVHGPVFAAGFRTNNDDPLAAVITVNGIEKLFSLYDTAEVDLHQRLRLEPWGARTFVVRDPDENLICFAGNSQVDRASATVIDVYRRHGAQWARLRGDRLAEGAWLDRFCALVAAGAEVLDIGCGSGLPIARELIRREFGVTGVDGAPEMLALFRHNLPGTPAMLSDMRALAVEKTFAGILAWDSFFHLSPADQRTMFTRFQAPAAPAAVLMFTSGPAEGSVVGELDGEPLYHGIHPLRAALLGGRTTGLKSARMSACRSGRWARSRYFRVPSVAGAGATSNGLRYWRKHSRLGRARRR